MGLRQPFKLESVLQISACKSSHRCSCLCKLNLWLTVTSSVNGWDNAVDPRQCTKNFICAQLLPGWRDTCVCHLFDCMTHFKHANEEQETRKPNTFPQPYQIKNLKIFNFCAILIRFLFIKKSMIGLIHLVTGSGNFQHSQVQEIAFAFWSLALDFVWEMQIRRQWCNNFCKNCCKMNRFLKPWLHYSYELTSVDKNWHQYITYIFFTQVYWSDHFLPLFCRTICMN